MNLFRLSADPKIAAVFNQDLHCVKIITEAVQLLSNCYPLEKLKEAPKTQKGNFRKYSHFNHPVAIWVRQNISNYNWCLAHFIALNEEFEYRFNKKHFCYSLIKWFENNRPELLDKPETEQPQCFKNYPECIVQNNPVRGYQNYYNKCKLKFDFGKKIVKAKWTKREIPEFVDKNELFK